MAEITRFVEDMSESDIERFEKRLFPTDGEHGCFGCSSVKGFLANGEKLLTVVNKDLETLKENNLTFQIIINRLRNLVNTAILELNKINKKEIILEDKYEIKFVRWMGTQYCPFSNIPDNYNCGPFSSVWGACGSSPDSVTIKNLNNNKEIEFCLLSLHLIEDHHFFEGSVKNRLDPLKIMEVIDTDIIKPIF